jgi:hypothetical protein
MTVIQPREEASLNPVLNIYLSKALAADRLREADRFRRSRVEWTRQPDSYDEVTVRMAGPEDTERVGHLAELDGRRALRGPILVAEVHGELLAARSLDGDGSIADPFHPTAQLVELLELRSAHLRDGSESRGPHRRGARRWLISVLATDRS